MTILRRALLTTMMVLLVVLLPATAALAQVPTEIPTELPTEPDPEPTSDPEPEPTTPPPTTAPPSTAPPSQSPSSQPSAQPTPEPTPEVADPTDAPSGGVGNLPTFDVSDAPADGSGGGGFLDPVVAPADAVAPAGGGNSSGGGTVGPDGRVQAAGISTLAAALPGTFAINLGAVLLSAVLGSLTLFMLRRGSFVMRTPDGGIDVQRTQRWRTGLGVALIAAAAVAGVIGYLKISLEPIVAVQVVYMASAGFAVIVLAVAGAAFLISEGLKTEESRINELEGAVISIATALAPSVQEPPRLLDRSAPEPAKKPAAKKPAAKRPVKKAAAKK